MRAFGMIAIYALLATSASAQTIGLSLREVDAFLSPLAKGVTTSAKAAGFDTQQTDAKADAGTQIADVKGLIASGVAGLVVVSTNKTAEVEIAALAKAANLPLVFVNRQPASELLVGRTSYVGSDEKVAAELQTREVCRQLQGKGDVAILMGELTHPAAKARTLEVHHVLGTPECSGLRILEEQSANWTREQASDVTRVWLDGGLHPQAVIANNDEMALGAVEAIKATGAKGILVAGVDATDAALAAMKAGDLSVTVLQDASGQGSLAVETVARMLRGEAVEPVQYVPFRLVLPSDVAGLVAQRAQN